MDTQLTDNFLPLENAVLEQNALVSTPATGWCCSTPAWAA